MKISDNILESGHESWHLINIGTIKEVAYVKCHQSRSSSMQTATSTCPIMRIKASRLNMMVHHLITGHWCIPLIDVRYPTDNDNGNQGTKCNLTSVNRCVEVEHLKESIDQGTLMYSQKCRWDEIRWKEGITVSLIIQHKVLSNAVWCGRTQKRCVQTSNNTENGWHQK